MKNRISKLVVLASAVTMTIIVSGCSTIVRENIISSINTGIGATLAENPQTQLYEVKIGYIRSQYYSIPTGKMILEENSAVATGHQGSGQSSSVYSDKTTNAANLTPELVSGIKVHSGAQHLFLGVDVSENFAVGATAVNSKAATAMYVSESKDAGVANAASFAATSVSKVPTIPSSEAQSLTSEIAKKYNGADSATKENIKKTVTNNGYKDWNSFLSSENHDPTTLIKIYTEVNKH